MPKTMVLHQDLNRLYVSMKEGILFIFDVKDITPIVIHTIIFPYYVKRISIDTNINLLQCLTTRGSLICMQLSTKNPKALEPTAYIESVCEGGDESFQICEMKWVTRHRSFTMNGTYFEGSLKGNLWLRDINTEQDKML